CFRFEIISLALDTEQPSKSISNPTKETAPASARSPDSAERSCFLQVLAASGNLGGSLMLVDKFLCRLRQLPILRRRKACRSGVLPHSCLPEKVSQLLKFVRWNGLDRRYRRFHDNRLDTDV